MTKRSELNERIHILRLTAKAQRMNAGHQWGRLKAMPAVQVTTFGVTLGIKIKQWFTPTGHALEALALIPPGPGALPRVLWGMLGYGTRFWVLRQLARRYGNILIKWNTMQPFLTRMLFLLFTPHPNTAAHQHKEAP